MKRKIGVALLVFSIISIMVFNVSIFANTNSSDQLLETSIKSYDTKSNVNEFDREKMFEVFYNNLSHNNPELNKEEKVRIANELLTLAENARKSALEKSVQSLSTHSLSEPVPLSIGRIENGKLITDDKSSLTITREINSEKSTTATAGYWVPDSRTSILSEGFSVTPHIQSSQDWVTHATSWRGLSRYTNSIAAMWTNNSALSVSKQFGYSGTLKSTHASSYGLTVTPTSTQTMTIPIGETFTVPAWTNKQVRPYIDWQLDQYAATYEYYCYNSMSQTYYYHYVNLSATNTKYLSKDKQFWTAENSTQNPNATSPTPPSGWY